MKFGKNVLLIKLLVILLCSAGLLTAVSCNYDSYETTIAKVIKVEEQYQQQKTIYHKYTEEYYRQHLTAEIKNGPRKGERIELEHTYGKSCVYDDKYKKGTCLFVNLKEGDDGGVTAAITGVKRDFYAALAGLLLLDALLLVGGAQGLLTAVSLFFNIFLFCKMLDMALRGYSVFYLSIGLTVIFCGMVLVLINGWNRRTAAAFAAAMGSVSAVTAISAAVLHWGPQVDYEFMEFLPQPYYQGSANLLFLSEILIGGLGVIMDVAVTITACASGLLKENPDISAKDLLRACREVSDDITGTMINVVFFSNVAACIPLFLLSMRNSISFVTVLRYGVFFELARFLTGAMGIIITIPLSIAAAMYFRKGGKKLC